MGDSRDRADNGATKPPRISPTKPRIHARNRRAEALFQHPVKDEIRGKTLKGMALSPRIYYTDLYSLTSRVAPEDEAVAIALAKSCKFPFAFVGFGSDNAEVDGGLALNLPVDELKNGESTHGSVIGVGFSNRFGDQGKRGILTYTQQLFSAAIQSSVARSERIIGAENFFAIDTDIGTFDFESALSRGLDAEYKLVRSQFESWLEVWLRERQPYAPTSTRLIYPSLSNNPWPETIIKEVNDRQTENPCTHANSLANYDVAVIDGSGRFLDRFRSRTQMKFTVLRQMRVLQFDFEVGRGGSFVAANLGCMAYDAKGNPLSFSPNVQELTRENDLLRTFRVYFLFDQALTAESPHQPYAVEYEYEGENPYPGLGKKTESSFLIRRQGDADELILAVAFPRSEVPIHVSEAADASWEKLATVDFYPSHGEVRGSEHLQATDFAPAMHLDHDIARYHLVGRRGIGIKQGQVIGFLID